MQKTWFIILLVALWLGQAPLASSVVICTTEDGEARLETLNHHDHDQAADHAHDHEPCHTEACPDSVGSSACCRDVTVDCASPSLVDAKKVGRDVPLLLQSRLKGGCSSQRNIHVTVFACCPLDTGPDALRSVFLLI